MGIKILDLKPGMNNVNIIVRVLHVDEPKKVMTRSGERTISEAVVGDETGRTKLTLWGKASGTVKEGEVIEITGAWTTVYKGLVQLNVGGSKSIKRLSDDILPAKDSIPETTPKASGVYRPRRFKRSRQGRRYSSRSKKGAT